MSKDIKTDNYTLLLGDCLERMKEIPDVSVDLCVSDILYKLTGGVKVTVLNQNDLKVFFQITLS